MDRPVRIRKSVCCYRKNIQYLYLRSYPEKFLAKRNAVIKEYAESQKVEGNIELTLNRCKKTNLRTIYQPVAPVIEFVGCCIVVIIDVLRATSTIATALYNGAKSIIPVDSVAECIRIGKQIDSITAGE